MTFKNEAQAMTNSLINSYEHHSDADRLKRELDEQRRMDDVRPMQLLSSLKLHKIPHDRWCGILKFDYEIPPRDGGDRLLNKELLDLCSQIVADETIDGTFSITKDSVKKLEGYVERRTDVRVYVGIPPEKPWLLQQIGPNSEWRDPSVFSPQIVWDLADAVYRFADEIRKARSTYFRIVRSKLPSEGGPDLADAFYLALFFNECLPSDENWDRWEKSHSTAV